MDWVVTISMGILWGVLGLLGLLLVVLHLPYRAKFTADWDEDTLDARAWLGLPLRLAGIRVNVRFEAQRLAVYFMGFRLFSRSFHELKRTRGGGAHPQFKTASRRKRKKTVGWIQAIYMSRMPYKFYLFRQLPRWFFLRMCLRGRFGFNDPYTTGQVEGALLMARTVMPPFGRDVAFDYLEPVFKGHVNISMVVWLPRIAVGMIAFLLRREGRSMLRHYRRRPRPTGQTA